MHAGWHVSSHTRIQEVGLGHTYVTDRGVQFDATHVRPLANLPCLSVSAGPRGSGVSSFEISTSGSALNAADMLQRVEQDLQAPALYG
jgi:hypothetical protein